MGPKGQLQGNFVTQALNCKIAQYKAFFHLIIPVALRDFFFSKYFFNHRVYKLASKLYL